MKSLEWSKHFLCSEKKCEIFSNNSTTDQTGKEDYWYYCLEAATLLRGFTAIGICATWMGLVFVGGKVPFFHDFQDFNIMFYNIIRKIFKYILALFFMVMGFGFANMAIHFGFGDQFVGLKSSFMKALVMTLGEYNLDDVEDNLDNNVAMKTFFFIILLCTIIFGSLTIINLFVAVVVSDVTSLREDVFVQVVKYKS